MATRLHNHTPVREQAHTHTHTMFLAEVEVFSEPWTGLCFCLLVFTSRAASPANHHSSCFEGVEGRSQSQLPFKQLYFQAKPGRHVVLLLRQILICLSVWLTKKKKPRQNPTLCCGGKHFPPQQWLQVKAVPYLLFPFFIISLVQSGRRVFGETEGRSPGSLSASLRGGK